MKTWTDVIGQEKEKPYFKHILQQVHQERLVGKTIYPPQDEVFNAFKYTAFDKVKSRHFRAGSLPWSKSSARFSFFGET